jgi:hypothetical protein
MRSLIGFEVDLRNRLYDLTTYDLTTWSHRDTPAYNARMSERAWNMAAIIVLLALMFLAFWIDQKHPFPVHVIRNPAIHS